MPRIKRGNPPARTLRRHNYRVALPELVRDFQHRCAYSMQHITHCGPHHIDHFDPRKKKDLIQQYDNLFLASAHCNGKKSDKWPNKAERRTGARFLNPCKEMDYGETIFEDANHQLVGTTIAARWHILQCDLNAPLLVDERRDRAKYRRDANSLVQQKRKSVDPQELLDVLRNYREMVERMIPVIPPPPR